MTRLKTLKPKIKIISTSRVPELPRVIERLYSSTQWLALMATLRRQRGNACAHCGSKGRTVGDHIVELKDGGAPLDPSNVQLLCWPCHTTKTNIARARRHATPVARKAD